MNNLHDGHVRFKYPLRLLLNSMFKLFSILIFVSVFWFLTISCYFLHYYWKKRYLRLSYKSLVHVIANMLNATALKQAHLNTMPPLSTLSCLTCLWRHFKMADMIFLHWKQTNPIIIYCLFCLPSCCASFDLWPHLHTKHMYWSCVK